MEGPICGGGVLAEVGLASGNGGRALGIRWGDRSEPKPAPRTCGGVAGPPWCGIAQVSHTRPRPLLVKSPNFAVLVPIRPSSAGSAPAGLAVAQLQASGG